MKLSQIKERCILLNIIATFYLDPVTKGGLQTLHDNPLIIDDDKIGQIWGEFSASVSDIVTEKQPDQSLSVLANEHLNLFVGLSMPLAPPWGSVYLNDENLLMQETTYCVQDFIEEHSLKFQPNERQPIDHIGFCLQVLATLLSRYTQSQDVTQLRPVGVFLEQHLLTWSPRFLALQQQHATTSFYRLIARLTEVLLQDLTIALGINQPCSKLYY